MGHNVKGPWRYRIDHQRLNASVAGNGGWFVWALIDPAAPKEDRTVLMTGTGHEFPDTSSADCWRHISTVLTDGENFVFHFFERVS